MAAAVGLAMGSFLLAGALRYPALDGFAFGRSSCPACARVIAPYDLIPLISWVWLRGRCRECSGRIGWQYPAIELAGAATAVWAATVFSGWMLWASCAFGWALLAASLIDLRCYRLPDGLTSAILLAGLAMTAVATPAALPGHLLGAAAGYVTVALIAITYRRLRGRDGIGLGDAKLLAAGGAWLSWQPLPEVVFLAACLALAAAVAYALLRRMPLALATRMPFGPFLSIAIWLLWLYPLGELTV